MKKILSLILAFSFFASEASFMDKVKALPGKAKEFALATKDAAKANKPKAIFTTLQIAVAAHRLHALGSPKCEKNLLTEDKNNFFSFGEYSPLGRKALEFTKDINFYYALGEELSPVEGKLSSLGGKVDNSGTIVNKNSENMDRSSNPKEDSSPADDKVGNTGTIVNKNSENMDRSSLPQEGTSTQYATAGKDSFGVSKLSESRNKARPSNPDKIKNKNLRPIKYVQDFFNAGIGGTLFILEILKRLTTKAK